MNEVKNLLNFYTSELNGTLCQLAQPLNDCFNLDAFFYSLMTPEGNFFQIGNQEECCNKAELFEILQEFQTHNLF